MEREAGAGECPGFQNDDTAGSWPDRIDFGSKLAPIPNIEVENKTWGLRTRPTQRTCSHDPRWGYSGDSGPNLNDESKC